MSRKLSLYLAIFLPATVITGLVLLPQVPSRKGPVYLVLAFLTWLALLTFPMWIRMFQQLAERTAHELQLSLETLFPLLKISMLTLVTLSCALATQAVWFPTVQGLLALVIGAGWAFLDLAGRIR